MGEICDHVLINGQKNRRNYGIDLLRIVSMFMVCTLHILGHGGVLNHTSVLTPQYEVAWFIETAAVCAVNCYALISGYVGVGLKYKVSNIVYLWLQVVFYSLGAAIIFKILFPDMYGIKQLIKSALPVTFDRYWYFTAYFGLFLFIPLLNSALNHLSEKQLRYTLISVLIVCTVLTVVINDVFNLNGGYSTLWLMVLYLVGGYMKKYDPLKKVKSKMCRLAIVAMIVLAWLSKLCMELATIKIFGQAKWGGTFITYLSPFIFMVAVFMIELFSRMQFKKKPLLIAFFAPVSFGVYLIHDNDFIRAKLIKGKFAFYAEKNAFVMALAVIGTALAIYIVCSLIDYLRMLLFKLLKIKPILQNIETKIRNKVLEEEKCLETTEN